MDGKIAKRSDDITEEMWNEVLEFNRNMVQEYLDNQAELAIKAIADNILWKKIIIELEMKDKLKMNMLVKIILPMKRHFQ